MKQEFWDDKRPFFLLFFPLLLLALILLWRPLAAATSAPSPAAPAADCGSPNFGGFYENDNFTLSGDLYVGDDVNIRDGATVTITAGSSVTFCGGYQIKMSGGGSLAARGAPTQTISFNAADPANNWRRIYFGDSHGSQSILQYVELNDGGGNDDTAENAALEVYTFNSVTAGPTPIIDHVAINDSGAYGLMIDMRSADDTPPSISNTSINNSARAAALIDAEALGGFLHGNSYSGNAVNSIQIRGSGSRLYHSQTWRNQGVPLELLGAAMVAAPGRDDPPPTLTIEPGTTFLMHPGAGLQVGTSLGRGGSLIGEGAADAPITFTRLNDTSAPWNSLRMELYADTKVDLSHVDFSYGGDGGAPGMLHQLGGGTLQMDHVTVRNALGTGYYGRGGAAVIRDSVFENNDKGMEIWFSVDAQIRSSVIQNNVTAGLESVDSGFGRACHDAIGNFWGSADGPLDAYASGDACGEGRTNDGGGDSVSGGVRYTPWLAGDGELQDRGVIQPQYNWMVADGVQTGTITVTLRDAQGVPLSGKEVTLESSVGVIQQPAQPTDAEGMTTAVISSTQTGFAYLTAYNVSDDRAISGIGGVRFWQGAGDAGGLINPSGAPYANPNLIIAGRPFQQGFPMGFRVPMQNSNPDPVDVQVIYGVTNLNIGVRFTPVYTSETRTLAPGDSWDAPGVWTPPYTGHRCVQAAILIDGGAEVISLAPTGTTTTVQKNTDTNSCNDAVNNIGKAKPGKPAFNGRKDLQKAGKHFFNVGGLFNKANSCIGGLGDTGDSRFFAPAANGRDYEEVVAVPSFDPPPLQADADLNQEQVDALNAAAQVSADIYAVRLALQETAQRLYAASLSDAANADYYHALQYDAYQDFNLQYAAELYALGDAIEQVLAVTQGAGVPDGSYRPEEYDAALAELQSEGFDADTLAYYQQAGLSQEQIDVLLEEKINDLEAAEPVFIGFYDYLAQTAAEARDRADDLTAQYGGGGLAPLALNAPRTYRFQPRDYSFQVGNPTAVTDTVRLEVRPVNVPINWSYSIAQDSWTLGPGEIVTATVTLYPGPTTVEGDTVQVAVEGYIDNDLIGGVLLEHATPRDIADAGALYLPLVVRP